tara:strand:+ start:509 stop:769 length:261 start_codon:yes stop_codon:yes gene_type:complete
MTTTTKPLSIMSKNAYDALIDQLRACKTTDEILEFESWFNSKVGSGPLYELICDLLRNRSISRVLAAKWLSTLINDRELKIEKSKK